MLNLPRFILSMNCFLRKSVGLYWLCSNNAFLNFVLPNIALLILPQQQLTTIFIPIILSQNGIDFSCVFFFVLWFFPHYSWPCGHFCIIQVLTNTFQPQASPKPKRKRSETSHDDEQHDRPSSLPERRKLVTTSTSDAKSAFSEPITARERIHIENVSLA